MRKLPFFKPNRGQRQWINDERQTARLIRLLWRHVSTADRKNSAFLTLLIRCSWVNGGQPEACRKWRNKHLAKWLGLAPDAQDGVIASALRGRLDLSQREANWLVRTPSGITAYYKAQRPAFLRQVVKHARTIRRAFALVSNSRQDVEQKIEQVGSLIFNLPKFRAPNKGLSSMMNGLAPALACLDPQCRFPIMNARTQRLLSVLGKDADVSGALSLSRLIGQNGIEDSFYLDVYAFTGGKKLKPARRGRAVHIHEPKTVGLKAEEAAVANYEKRRGVIRKRHNALINAFVRAVEWRHVPKESEYDLLIENWKPGRWLLIEAKTETAGVGGRSQLRQAIGQLFDYRWRSFREKTKKVDIALLTPSKPDKDVLALLKKLGINALWFANEKLMGTIDLC